MKDIVAFQILVKAGLHAAVVKFMHRCRGIPGGATEGEASGAQIEGPIPHILCINILASSTILPF